MTGIDHRDAASCVQFARDERRERTQPRRPRPLAITPPSSSSSRIRSQNKRRKITWRLSCSREAGWQTHTHTSPVGRGRKSRKVGGKKNETKASLALSLIKRFAVDASTEGTGKTCVRFCPYIATFGKAQILRQRKRSFHWFVR